MPNSVPPPLDVLADDDALIPLPQPEPVPDMATYERERERALAFSPERRANYERAMSAARGADVDYLPVKLDIENVSRCNFRCTMCQVSEWPKGRRARDMTLDEFKRLIDQQYSLVEIKIQGQGEPTLQGDDFIAMISYARSKAIWVRVITNGSLLHLRDNYKKLIDSGVNEVQISIDGADKKTFEDIRRGSVFEQVIKNCRSINDYCHQLGIERTKMWTVVQAGNRHQIRELIELGRDVGFKSLVFSLNLEDFGLDSWRERNQAVSVGHSFTNRQALEFKEFGDSLGLKVRFWRSTSKYSTDKVENLCPWPFERSYISSDMRVSPCCVIANPDIVDFGSAVDFTATWKNEAMRQFRQDHLDGRIPEVCKLCYHERTKG